jgi:hypothetical protein
VANPKRGTDDFRGARGSNAGDQFHELWALQQALSLLIPNTPLSALTVEGVSSDADSADENANKWEGADCALYFGGRTLEGASRVEIVQLKYSSSNPDTAWTVARLTHSTRKRAGDNSVLRRLADAFAAARQLIRSDATLTVRLVSNQPIAAEVTDAVAAHLSATPAPGAPPKAPEKLVQLKSAAGLNDSDFTEFLRALDLSECGASSRFTLRDSILATVALSSGEDINAQTRDLQTRVRELMLPGVRDVVTFETVLGWFDIASRRGLFPAPSDFKPLTNVILRTPARALLEKVESGARLICLDGPAGCGKTTTIRQLEALLPLGSAFIAFDCYGSGRYSHSDDRRHLPENAFVQIANELSLKLGIPLLLAQSGRRPTGIQRFIEHVQRAAALLKDTHPAALLVIAIDAADNSVTAASKQVPPDKCFVHELVQANFADLADNVRFIVSTRPGRKSALLLPPGTAEEPCPPFEHSETEQMARLAFPEASEAWIEQFHALSRGVPRVQGYAITAGNGDPNRTLDALRPGGKGLSEVLRQLFATASGKIGDANLYSAFMAALAALPAPIPPAHLAAVCGATTDEVLDIVNDVDPGLRLDPDGVSIADEDVEDFINVEGAKQLADAQLRACKLFAGLYLTDTYAAIHYSDFLVATGQASEILTIIERDLAPAAIADPIVRREAQLRRLRQALSACEAAGDPVASTKVVILSAEASKGEAALAEILEKQPDLSIRFARASLTRLVLSDPDNAPRQGAVVAQAALMAAQRGDRIQTREQLILHDVWLDRRKLATENEKHKWHLEDHDIAVRSEAIFLIFGPERGLAELRRWSPPHVPLQVALELVPALIAHGHSEIVTQTLKQNLVRGASRLVLMVPLALSGTAFTTEEWERALRALRQPLVPRLEDIGYVSSTDTWPAGFLDTVMTACEIGLSVGVSAAVLSRALGLICDWDATPKRRYTSSESYKIDLALRGWLLMCQLKGLEPTAELFLSHIEPAPVQSVAKKSSGKKSQRKKATPRRDPDRTDDELKRIVGAIFRLYHSRLNVLARTACSAEDEGVRALSSLRDDYSIERSHWGQIFRFKAAASIMKLMHLPNLLPKDLFEKAASLVASKYGDPFATQLLPLWRMLLLRQDCHDFILAGVSKKAEQASKERAPASEKVDAFLEFSRLVLNFSEPDAQTFFEEAIARAQDIDREAFDQIEFLRSCTSHSASWPSGERTELASKVFRFVTDVAERLRNEEHFPWKDSIKTLARLSPEATFAAVSQWSDYGIRSHEATLAPMLRELLARGTISPAVAASLLVLAEAQNQDLVAAIGAASAIDDIQRHKAIGELLASDCLLLVPPGERLDFGRAILSSMGSSAALSENGALRKLRDTVNFLEREKPTTTKIDDISARKLKPQLDLSGRHFLSAGDITGAIEEARQLDGYLSVRDLFARMRKTVTAPGERTAFLSALTTVPVDYIYGESLAAAIRDALEAWSSSPSVMRWRDMNLPSFITDNFSILARSLKYEGRELVRLLDSFSASAGVRQKILVKGVQGTGQTLGSESLFRVAELMAGTLASEEALTTIKWYADRLNSRLPEEATRLNPSDLPSDVSASIGRFITALFSDIDARVRWRAAHAARRLARLGENEAFNSIFANYTRKSDPSFRDSTAPYYWLSARLFTVIVAARVAVETPDAIVPLFQQLVGISLDEQFPHLLIREHARRAVKAVLSSGKASLPADTLARMEQMNAPKLPRKPKKSDQRTRHLGWDDKKARRFDFNSDVLEKPYSRLFRMFENLTKDEFFDALEHWLVDQWGAPEKVHHYDLEPRKARYNDEQYSLWYSRDGELPLVERYATHLEWHAMFCAMGQLIERHALILPEDDYDRFERWLADGLPTVAPCWLADFRDPTPLQASIWYKDDQADRYWLSRVSTERFLETLQPYGKGADALVTVRGDWTAAFPTREIDTRVTSALVTADTALALARALHDDDHYFGVWLPTEGSDDQIAEPGYRLLGWMRDEDREGRFDYRDPLRHGIRSSLRLPGTQVAIDCGLQAEALPNRDWVFGASREVGFQTVTWSDLAETYDDGRHRGRRTKSEGWQAQVRRDLLVTFLQHMKMDLIVGVHIERKIENEYGRSYDTETKKKSFNRVFIYRSNGVIEDVKGRVGSWNGASKRI